MKIQAAPGMIFRSTKTYGHSIGLSCCFRQWRASSHCRFLHGYALKVHLEFSAIELDQNNWSVDFGGLKEVKSYLEIMFDHKTLVAEDDPEMVYFQRLAEVGLIQLQIVDSVGVEAFAYMIYQWINVHVMPKFPHARLNKVSIHEHEGNGAEYGLASGNANELLTHKPAF